ncbi:cytochrome P450 [Novosphingobium profundi]|uniref:cytochrome P450 n=1 Tax=Novosphingobium profundi TaxID=1774954 RepID=UPI001BDB26C1|nr:cytochrome P450 [Novosphingobium profundi]MBT0669159.1 cytochrome P450 [Novosphingobium profundi]
MHDATALTGENLFNDPYPVYARLRNEHGIVRFEGSREYFVTRWSDCQTVGANEKVFAPSDSQDRPEARVFGLPNVLSMSGPEHQALRTGIDYEVQQERVDGYVDALARPIVNRYIDAIATRGQADLTQDLFEPISVRLIGDLIGLKHIPNPQLQAWFHAINGGLQNIVAQDPEVWRTCDSAIAEIDAVLRPLYETVSARPDSSLFSHAVHGGLPDGQRRAFDAIMPTIRVIILGGLQEPGHGAANAALGVLQDEVQGALLREQPSAFALKAYDEGLRWIAPIGVTPRVAQEDFVLSGTRIEEGASVAIVLASANRDASRWEKADTFDMTRKKKAHASFGYRPHFCSGHYLSRAVGRIALEEAFTRLRNLRLDPAGEVQTKGWRFRGVTHLPARWDP